MVGSAGASYCPPVMPRLATHLPMCLSLVTLTSILRTGKPILVELIDLGFKTQNGMPYFIAYLMTILLLIGIVFVIIWEMFYRKISLSSVLLLQLVNFVSCSGWNWCIYPHHIRSNLTNCSSPWFSAACAAAIVHRNHFFCLYQQNKSSESKVKFKQASNCYKRVLQAAKLTYGNKAKDSITSQKLGSCDIWWIANSVFNKGESAIPSLFNTPEVLSSASDKAKLFCQKLL